MAKVTARIAVLMAVMASPLAADEELNTDSCGDIDCGATVQLLQQDIKLEHSLNAGNEMNRIQKSVVAAPRAAPSKAEHSVHLKEETSTRALDLTSPVQPATTVETTSWFERLGNAFWSVLIGIFVIIPFSIAFLWVNEKRNAMLESILSLGESEAKTIDTKQNDLAYYDGTLVHIDSEQARGLDPVQDARFPSVRKEKGCIRLVSDVEVYQWKEISHEKKEKQSLGGGEKKTTTYDYKQDWSSTRIDSNSFHDKDARAKKKNTCSIEDLSPGVKEVVNTTVTYGENYWLKEDLIKKLSNFENVSRWVGNEFKFRSTKGSTSHTFTLKDQYYYLFPARSNKPEIGDFRVKITYVGDGDATILALQTNDKSTNQRGRTFGPYRMISRGCCGTSEEELKLRRLEAAKKTGDDIYDEEKCWDFTPFNCLCCCCNMVLYLFTQVEDTLPQIYSAWSGKKSIKVCFQSEKSAGMAMKWGFRLFGWLLLWIGFMMLFEPLEVFMDIIPFLGPYIGTALKYIIGFFCFLLTAVLAFLIVSLAYMLYHPLVGIMYLGCTALVVAFILWCGSQVQGQQA